MGLADWFSRDTVEQAKSLIVEAADRGLDRNVKLAVTGLSRSGKTAFITSLVSQLLHGNEPGRLPFFKPLDSGRLIACKVSQQPDLLLPSFPYHQAMQSLQADKPQWPESTRGISQIRLNLKYHTAHGLWSKLSSVSRLNLDIIDYPGEWLLDLPLLDMDFKQWSLFCAQLCADEPRSSLASDWAKALAEVDFTAPSDDLELRKLAGLYKEFLHQCKSEPHYLSLIQPGRFVLPGELAGAPVLEFCPLITEDFDWSDIPAGSHAAVMEERFEYYKSHVVKTFYQDYFEKFDRQIILLDCLQTLNHGKACYQDMQKALSVLLASFNYGHSGLLGRLFSPKIDRLLFAATKADHLPPDQHGQLQQFLQRMVNQARNDIQYQGVDSQLMAIASVQVTEPVIAEHDGEKLTCIKGRSTESGEMMINFPGAIPSGSMSQFDWQSREFDFAEFLPHSGTASSDAPLPHIRIDKVMQYLLGDKFL